MIDSRILDFITANHLLSLSVLEIVENKCDEIEFDNKQNDKYDNKALKGHLCEVYSANCYYAFDNISCKKEIFCLLIKSNPKSKHIRLALHNPQVALTIAKDTNKIQNIQGLQMKAILGHSSPLQNQLYHSVFPFARLWRGKVFALQIKWAKYTDNTSLLSKKIIFDDTKG